MLDLFILETCPYCKKVLKFIEDNGIKFRKFDTSNNDNALKLLNLGGKDQVPYLYDNDTKTGMYESADIIKYLAKYIRG